MKNGIGNYASSTTNSMCAVAFVEADTSKLLLTHHNDSLIPRIGETILIRKDGRPDRSYQVRDVVWEFIWNADCSWLKDVVVILVKEDPDVVRANSSQGLNDLLQQRTRRHDVHGTISRVKLVCSCSKSVFHAVRTDASPA
jgi:hypothetical protein